MLRCAVLVASVSPTGTLCSRALATAEQERKGPSRVPVLHGDLKVGAYVSRNDQPGQMLDLFEVVEVEDGVSPGRYVKLLSVSESFDNPPLRLTARWICTHFWLERRAPEPETFDWR